MRFLDLNEGPNDPNIFKAIILAGGPGSGKSYVASELGLAAKGLRVINSDEPLEYLMRKKNLDLTMPPEQETERNVERARAKQIADTKHNLALDGRLGLIIDGTAKDVNKTAAVKKTLEQLGYQVMMLFVDTSLRTAMTRNNMRPRRVPADVVAKSHKEVQANKLMLRNLFGNNYLEVNNEGVSNFADAEKAVRAFLNAPLSPIAKDWLSKQKVVQEESVTETRQPGEYVYHATVKSRHPEQLIRSLISYGLRPSPDGYAGPGSYFAYEPNEGYYHMRPEEAVILRVKWQDLVDMYGVYPSNPDGIERDDEEIIVPGGVPSTAIEIELKPGVWQDLQTALSSVLSRYTAEDQPADSTLAKIKERWTALHEDVTPDQLKQIETYADVLFSKVGINVEFTRHFADRVNDLRNRKPINSAELIRLFKKEYLKWGKPIAQLGPEAEAVMRDMQTDVNMPFVLKWDRRTQQLELIAKTVMRKQDFKTPDPVFAVESASTPKIIYHGNQGGIDVNRLQMPMWFSTSKDSVMHYAGDDGFVVVAELRPQKTLTVDSSGDANAAHSKWRALVAQGYDTVMHQNGASQDWIILDPDCIAVVDVEDADAVSEAIVFPIPRDQMPQIDLADVEHDFRVRRGTVSLSKLRPVQTDRVPGLVDKTIDMILGNKMDKPIMVDRNGYIVNGHHRYDAYKKLGAKADFPVPVVMIYATLEQILDRYSHTTSDEPVISEAELKKNKWALIVSDADKSQWSEELIGLVNNAYMHTNLGSFVQDLYAVKGSEWVALDWDRDPDLDCTIFFRKNRANETWTGFKVQGIGHDGAPESKSKIMNRLVLSLNKPGYWIESSGALARALAKRGAVPVTDEAVCQSIFPGTNLKMIDADTGLYQREANGQVIQEIIYGNPKAVSPVTETTAGSIATVVAPMGSMLRRPNPSIYNHTATGAKTRKKKK